MEVEHSRVRLELEWSQIEQAPSKACVKMDRGADKTSSWSKGFKLTILHCRQWTRWRSYIRLMARLRIQAAGCNSVILKLSMSLPSCQPLAPCCADIADVKSHPVVVSQSLNCTPSISRLPWLYPATFQSHLPYWGWSWFGAYDAIFGEMNNLRLATFLLFTRAGEWTSVSFIRSSLSETSFRSQASQLPQEWAKVVDDPGVQRFLTHIIPGFC